MHIIINAAVAEMICKCRANRFFGVERLRCIYDQYLSVSNKICTVDVVLSDDDEHYLIDNLLEDSQVILKYISSVNAKEAKEAKSSNPNQEDKLRKEIVKVGYARIDESIRDRLREWFAHAATGYIKARKEEFKSTRKTVLSTVHTPVENGCKDAGRVRQVG